VGCLWLCPEALFVTEIERLAAASFDVILISVIKRLKCWWKVMKRTKDGGKLGEKCLGEKGKGGQSV